MIRGAKFFVKGCDGAACGPFRWTAVREWVAVGYFTADDAVRLAEVTEWTAIGGIPELMATPPGNETNEALTALRRRASEKKAIAPRTEAYLKRLGCPVRPERLNPYTAFLWVRTMEELNPPQADATERWAAGEASNDRAHSATENDATPAQIETLRAKGIAVPVGLTRLQAQRLISGPPTEGQLRRIQFYGIPLPEGAGKDEASDLIDRHIRENWDSEEAYQASRRKIESEWGDGKKTGPVLKLRPAPPAADAKFAAPSTVRQGPPAAPPAHRSVGPRPARRAPSRAIIVSCLLGMVVLVAVWAIVRKRMGADSNQAALGSTNPAGREAMTAEINVARSVTVMESPDRRRAEQLRGWVIALPLTGIMGGAEPRALVDGRMYRVGDAVDRPRGIVILQIDSDKKTVVFGDGAGSIVRRVLE